MEEGLIGFIATMAIVITVAIFIKKDGGAQAVCRTSDVGGNYCKYTGKIEQVYLNKDGLALFYLKDDFNKQNALEKGYVINNTGVVTINVKDGSVESEMYRSLQLAFLEGEHVELHMRSVESGSLVVDRFWMK